MPFDNVLEMLDSTDSNMGASSISGNDNSCQSLITPAPHDTDVDAICKHIDPFNISVFIDELREISDAHTRKYIDNMSNISAYSISHECILTSIYKLTNYPIENAASSWLPVMMRSVLGNAVHDFIQKNTAQFTECEVTLKIPSIKMSCRLDALIGDTILVEIKSCTYEDYAKIIRSNKPRKSDLLQAIVYVYLLTNYLHQSKTEKVTRRTPPPILPIYNITKIQFIYVAHDITTSDCCSMPQAVKKAKELRQKLDSKINEFCFINSVVVDITLAEITPVFEYIKEKIDAINQFVETNTLPISTNKFIDRSKCFLCMYSKTCNFKKK